MCCSNVVPIRSVAEKRDWGRGLNPAAAERVRQVARDNISLLQSGVGQCVYIAVEGSEEVAATMIDYAIELNTQAREAIQRYGFATSQWEDLSLSEAG